MSICASGRNRRSANREGVESTVSPIERSRITNTLFTFDQSQRAGAKGLGASVRNMAFVSSTLGGREESTMSRRSFIGSLFDGGCVNEHYGNVVVDWINALTLDAFQSASVRLQLNIGLAGRTREYFQEFLINCHG